MTQAIVVTFLALAAVPAAAQPPTHPVARHTFALGATDFLLDGAPFQIIGCEMHPARIPAEYWAHRIRMAKAHGLQHDRRLHLLELPRDRRGRCSTSRPAIATSPGSSGSSRPRACG